MAQPTLHPSSDHLDACALRTLPRMMFCLPYIVALRRSRGCLESAPTHEIGCRRFHDPFTLVYISCLRFLHLPDFPAVLFIRSSSNFRSQSISHQIRNGGGFCLSKFDQCCGRYSRGSDPARSDASLSGGSRCADIDRNRSHLSITLAAV